MEKKTVITVKATIKAPVEKVWKLWTEPFHVMQWNNASDDWHTPKAENDLRVGGKFNYRMAAKDGSFSFDFWGIYDEVKPLHKIVYTMGDGRKATITFSKKKDKSQIVEAFEAENENSVELQKNGWQAILNNFKKHTESYGVLETLQFDILIDASPKEVHKIMIDDKQYRIWTAAFNPGSYFVGTWETGSKILFVGDEADGSQSGMVTMVRENAPGKHIYLDHIGMLSKGKEITSGPEVEAWAGAFENYTFEPEGKKTRLKVAMSTSPAYTAYFEETWPKALAILKELCEGMI